MPASDALKAAAARQVVNMGALSAPARDEIKIFAGKRVLAADGEVIIHPFGEDFPRYILHELGATLPAAGWYTIPEEGEDCAPLPANNPWKPETFNLTQQIELMRDRPKIAARLIAAAGL